MRLLCPQAEGRFLGNRARRTRSSTVGVTADLGGRKAMSSRSKRALVFVSAVLLVVPLLVLTAPSAAAAPPSNDNFVDATALVGSSGQVFGSNVDATAEPGEPPRSGSDA